jgi:hypothetical protein
MCELAGLVSPNINNKAAASPIGEPQMHVGAIMQQHQLIAAAE